METNEPPQKIDYILIFAMGIYFIILELFDLISYAKEIIMVQALLGYALGRKADRIDAFVRSLFKKRNNPHSDN